MKNIFSKLASGNGRLSRAVVIMLVLVLAMLIVVSVPLFIHFRDHSREIGCMTALDTANRELATAYLMSGGTLSAKEAKDVVTRAMDGWDDLCPGGGTMMIVPDSEGEIPYKLLCGMHCADKKERTRACAAYVLDRLRDSVAVEYVKNGAFPPEAVIMLNGEELRVILTDKNVGIRRGTGSTSGFEGTVAYYAASGSSEFGSSFGAPNGEISWFVFADEDHCAAWNYRERWTGESFN